MADKYIYIELEGEDKIILGLERMQVRMQGKLREMIDELAHLAEDALVAFVPTYSLYILDQIDREGPVWMPGGAGGGGEWKAIVGVQEGASRHPIYAEFGTGIYAGKGLIWASGVTGLTGRYQGVMTFQKRGEPRRFRYWVKGQRGQHYMYRTWQITNAVARARVLARSIYE